MLSWSSPLWLSALVLVPLIRWLHKINIRETAIEVSSILFWKTSATTSSSYGQAVKVDPIWMLRALIVALIILSLAGPMLPDRKQRLVQVWFDDALSMQTMEPNSGRSRLTLAIDSLIEELDALGSVQTKIFSLRNPGLMPMLLDSQNRHAWKENLFEWTRSDSKPLSLPLAERFIEHHESWLVTDGADPELKQLLSTRPINKIIRVGQATENSALTQLSIRPSLLFSNRWQGVVRVSHFGDVESNRTVELWQDGQKLEQWSMTLSPGQTRTVDFIVDNLPTKPTMIVARLSPSDHLPVDDSLSLSFPEPIIVKIHGDCPSPLMAAVDAHPFLIKETSGSEETRLDIVCGEQILQGAGPRLQFHQTGGAALPIGAQPVWTEAAGDLDDLRIPKHLLRQVRSANIHSGGIPVLQTGSVPLITLTNTSPEVLDCYIDMGWDEFAGRAEYPALFAGLVDLVMNRVYLNPIEGKNRNPAFSRIKPLTLVSDNAVNKKAFETAYRDRASYLIWLAMVLLIVDSAFVRMRRTGRS
ncbi:MAG: BatA domain-containing protein [Gammaproteobacteria bacterium]